MKRAPQPDILLVVLDTLRVDRLSTYGYSKKTTPNIDAFAEQSILFERAISPAQWTIPAHASLFTGEYPSTHLTHQIYDKHSKDIATLAEHLQGSGYKTVGFCNNPLLGVVENELDRGFEEFYNYGGLFPKRPAISESRPRRAGQTMQHIWRQLNRFNQPVQDWVTHNNLLLGIMLHPLISPFWQRHINFKGNSKQSLGDLVGYLRTRKKREDKRPIFTFLNLMETHLPYGPPTRFIRKFAPDYLYNRKARNFMQSYNYSTYRWITPITKPFTEMEDRVLNDMYDAEVAYEDHLLHQLLDYVNQPEVRDNTLVIFVADHGEGVNHHDYVGHSLVTYNDLVHVPLIMRYPPRCSQGKRINTPVSTRRVFHTILDVAGVDPTAQDSQVPEIAAQELSLFNSLNGSDPEQGTVFAEAYPPQTLISLIETKEPNIINAFRCRSTRRALFAKSLSDHHKLITVDEQPEELFDVHADPRELQNLASENPKITMAFDALLKNAVAAAKARQPLALQTASQLNFSGDKNLTDRLRGLGYIE
jgi:uncharacterized sulfatase